MTDESYGFSDDAPKENPWTDDKLGVAPFAKRLASVILGIDAPNGYVIGLQGAWGSGKSTALRVVGESIKNTTTNWPMEVAS